MNVTTSLENQPQWPDLDDAFALGDRVNQRFKYGTAVSPFKEHVRIGRDLERRSGKTEEAIIHSRILPVVPVRILACGYIA